MSGITTTLVKRFRAHAISLPTKLLHHVVSSKSLNIDTAKQRTADWEPSISFESLKPTSKRNDHNEGTKLVQMATHPFLLSSALPIPASSSIAKASATSSLRHVIKVQQRTPVANERKLKSWPYSLPKTLWSKVRTTCGDSVGIGRQEHAKWVGVLQSVLYGFSEPRKRIETKGEKQCESREKRLWRRVVYGVQDEDGKAGC